ncbi:MAG: low molecular weight phosphotyrosine protein phosphatase [Inhella sp.]|jgi:protein-tyrosine phosphatase|uniref:arsenate reductase/protein-tyrosine-phosphatase family protein n=1 Tax=Inhella sp. TaxID=1921806 RepID=UPI0022CC7348|nr:low molecular weight phosphotyrosine protein phosphatase [Inhella sp.]MCZ8235414.1 low molecular weight phosphotyrosine protein phosphatase [Inhella sp.]
MPESVLFVCRANLCRSAMAEAVLRACAPALGVDRVGSAGVWAATRPQPMDPRARAALERRRYEVPAPWRSRRVSPNDLADWDLILAADHEVLAALQRLWPDAPSSRLRLMLDHLPAHAGQDVPDPYFCSEAGFEAALTLIEQAVGGLGRA